MGTMANYQVWSMTQDNNKTMIFANRKGLLTFDGINWEQIELQSFPSTLFNHTESGNVFVGCNGDFGYLLKNEKGEYIYNSLKPDTLKIGLVGKISADSNYVYFLSEELIVGAKLKYLSKTTVVKSEPFSYLAYTFSIGGKVFVINQEDRIYTLDNLLLLPLNTNHP
jgi:hypothetical protein